jgi:hypothetical protein
MGSLTVTMKGMLKDVDIRKTSTDKKYAKGKFCIPLEAYNGEEYEKKVPFVAWEDMADIIEEIPDTLEVTAEGVLRTSSYETKCPHCKENITAWWTDVVINNIEV